jgi:TctA family transporter
VSFYLEPATALILLAGVYYGAEYGGSTASILLNLPGTPSNAVTCLDGYQMARQGRAGVALLTSTLSSFVGGTIGIVLMMGLTPLVVAFAMSITPADYFMVMLFGLIASASVGQGSVIKGIAMVILGVLLGTIGLDQNSAEVRFDFGFTGLSDGLSLVVLAMGLFGVSEVIASVRSGQHGAVTQRVTMRSMLPTRDDFRRSILPTLRGTAVGSFFGPLPGTGPSISSFMAYAVETKVSRDPSRFGRGAIEGVAAPEAANNAAVQTAFIPTLALAIPGTPTMAIMLGALLIHGITPGPRFMTENPDIYWGLIMSFWIGNLLLLVLNIPLIGLWVRILNIPYRYLYPGILCLICIGVFSVSGNPFDIWLVLVFGLLGYGMRLFGFEPAPLLLGFILGPLMETNLRRALLLSRGDFTTLVASPLSATLVAIGVAVLGWVILRRLRRRATPTELP